MAQKGNCRFGRTCRTKPCERNHECHFFNKEQGCENGDECKFEHNEPRCSWGKLCNRHSCTLPHDCLAFKRHGACVFGDDCRLLHGSSRRPPAHRPRYDSDLVVFEDELLARPATALAVCSFAADSPASCPDYDPLEEDTTVRQTTLRTAAVSIRSQLDKIASDRSKAQIVSLCFVLDCTGSMEECIDAARKQIESILRIIQEKGCRVERVAFVGYRDWSDGALQFDILPFTSDVSAFKEKLHSVKADGGGDLPEDVLGGLAKAAQLDWPESSGTRVMFHLGDAPPHGKRFYPEGRDNFPNGHPSDMPVPELFALMASKNIEYYFGEFNHSTDLMKAIFAEACGRPVDEVASSAKDLATLSATVSSSILRAVSSSVLRSSTRVPSGQSGATGHAAAEAAAAIPLVRAPPASWDALPELVAMHLTIDAKQADVGHVREGLGFDAVRKPTSLKIAPHPFAKGSSRLAYYGKNFFRSSRTDTVQEYDVVYKTFIRQSAHKDPRMDSARYLVDLQCQTVASQLACDFSRALERKRVPCNYQLRYLKAKLVQFDDPATGRRRYAMEEKLFRGGMQLVKYTSNSRYVRVDPLPGVADWQGKIDFLLAFSHFTYQHSQQYLVVTDLQGVIVDESEAKLLDEDAEHGPGGAAAAAAAAAAATKKPGTKITLTDPAIHCARSLGRFGATDLGAIGVADFTAMHRGHCTGVCRALGLTPL